MKKILVLLLITSPFAAPAQLEVYARYSAGGYPEPDINYFGVKKLTGKISLTFFGLVEQKWSEALIGLSFVPLKSWTVGISAGIENGTNRPRFSAGIRTEKGKTSFNLLGELGSGKDNYLYKANLFYQYTGWLTFGLTAWRYHGVGPNLRFRIPQYPPAIWVMPAYDVETNTSRLMFGISMNL